MPKRRSVITNIPVRNVPEERISLVESVCYYNEFCCYSCCLKSLSIFIIGIYYGLGSRWRVTLPVNVGVCVSDVGDVCWSVLNTKLWDLLQFQNTKQAYVSKLLAAIPSWQF